MPGHCQPVTWHPVHSDLLTQLGAPLYQCLCETGSMTAYLRSKSPDLGVHLLHQDLQSITDPELAHYMGITDAKPALVRQVILSCHTQPCILGHCIVPHAMYHEHKNWLAALGQRSIGEYLFASVHLQRTPILYAQLPTDSFYHRLLAEKQIEIDTPLWARRSQLFDGRIRVGIIEVMLPGLLAIQ